MDPPSVTSTLWKELLDEDLALISSSSTGDSIVTNSSTSAPVSDLITSSSTNLTCFKTLPSQAPGINTYGGTNKARLSQLLPQSSHILPRSNLATPYFYDCFNSLALSHNSDMKSQWESPNELIDNLDSKWHAQVNCDQDIHGSQTQWYPVSCKTSFPNEDVECWLQGNTLSCTSSSWSALYSHPPSDAIQGLPDAIDSYAIPSPPSTPDGAAPTSVLDQNQAVLFELPSSTIAANQIPRPDDSLYPSYSVIAQKIAGLALEEINTRLSDNQTQSSSLQSSFQPSDAVIFHLSSMLPATIPVTIAATPPWSPVHSCSSDTKLRSQTRLPRKDLVSLMEELAAYKAQRCGDSQDYPKRIGLDFRREVPQMQKHAVEKGCVFCKNNNYHSTFYTSHILKDEHGVCQCPVLRTYVCPLCGASGDTAHTLKYCPRNVITKGDPISAGLPPGKVTNWKEVARQLF